MLCTYVHDLGALPIMTYFYFLVLKKKPRLLLGSRKLFAKRQVKILKIWVHIRNQPLLHYYLFNILEIQFLGFQKLGLGLGLGLGIGLTYLSYEVSVCKV